MRNRAVRWAAGDKAGGQESRRAMFGNQRFNIGILSIPICCSMSVTADSSDLNQTGQEI